MTQLVIPGKMSRDTGHKKHKCSLASGETKWTQSKEVPGMYTPREQKWRPQLGDTPERERGEKRGKRGSHSAN